MEKCKDCINAYDIKFRVLSWGRYKTCRCDAFPPLKHGGERIGKVGYWLSSHERPCTNKFVRYTPELYVARLLEPMSRGK
jgi:hypothetical protein